MSMTLDRQPATEVALFSTDLGWMAAVGSGRMLRGLVFGHATKAEARAAAISHERGACELVERPWCANLIEMLERYASGDEVDFSDVELERPQWTAFQARVVGACRRVRYGETIGYGRLAAAAGYPGAARAVGNCMAANRFPLVVPCHRVVNADGSIGHFSCPQGPQMKERLLALEARGAWSQSAPVAKKRNRPKPRERSETASFAPTA